MRLDIDLSVTFKCGQDITHGLTRNFIHLKWLRARKFIKLTIEEQFITLPSNLTRPCQYPSTNGQFHPSVSNITQNSHRNKAAIRNCGQEQSVKRLQGFVTRGFSVCLLLIMFCIKHVDLLIKKTHKTVPNADVLFS